MKISPSTQFKAAFLTFVFLLNTIAGVACAIGTDMGFSRDHHKEQKTVKSGEHVHRNNKSHDHTKHEYNKSVADQHVPKSSEDNCCRDEVTKLSKADKINQPGYDYSLLSSAFYLLPFTIYHMGNQGIFPVNIPNSYFARHCRSPIPDKRIDIQSFQI